MWIFIERHTFSKIFREEWQTCKKTLKKGNVFHFPPNFIHQEEALTDCEIIEASSPHFNDRVRVEKFFGLKEFGLPTTKKKEITFK